MNDPLTEFNKMKISKINELKKGYNDALQKLMSQYYSVLNNIYNSRTSVSSKRNSINQLNNYYNNIINNLKLQLNNNILAVQNLTYIPPITSSNTNSNTTISLINNTNALIIGINYIGSQYQLNGCINDANSINKLLETTYGFKNIKLLTDNTSEKPTRDNIINQFTKLLTNTKSGDTIFLSYSGHGSTSLDTNNEEKTGKDQMIVPCDFNYIVDDDLKKIIDKNLKPNVMLIALFDCCFSESVLDLKYQYLDSLDNNNDTQNNKETETNGNIIMISGCSDIQTSADAFINNKNQGALTWAFLETLNSKKNQTWRQLLVGMRNLLSSNGYEQIPQLSSGKFMNIDSEVFI
jgi:hypothetical protein